MGVKSIALTVLGVGTVGGMVTEGYFFMQPQNIKDLLMQDQLSPLDISENTSNDEQWGELVKLHKDGTEAITLKNNLSVKLLIGQENISTTGNEGIKKLKAECKKLFEKKITNTKEEDKTNAKNWCTKESPLLNKDNFPEPSKPVIPQAQKNLRQILNDEKITFLGENDGLKWEQLVAKLLEKNSNFAKIDVQGIVKASPPSNNSENVTKLKAACDTLLKKTENIAQNKEIAKNWCTTSSTLLNSRD